MSNSNSPRLGLPYLSASQAQKHITLNTGLAELDGLVQMAIESRSLTSQPTNPQDGQMWLVPATATGTVFSSNIGNCLRYEDGSWNILPLVTGQVLFIKDEQQLFVNQAQGLVPLLTNDHLPWRNRIINGGFSIWQRGTSFTLASNVTSFTSDRWQVWIAGASASAQKATTALPPGSFNALMVNGATGITNSAISQTLESQMIRDLAGQRVSLSGWIYVSSRLSPTLNLYQYGTLDSANSRSFAATFVIGNLNPGWNALNKTFVLPQGLINGGQIEIGFGALSAGVSVGLAAIQLEPGGMVTGFEFRPPGVELSLCQRYFQLTAASYGAMGGWTSPTSAIVMGNLVTPMRTAPTLQPLSGNSLAIDCAGSGSATSTYTVNNSPTNFTLTLNGLNPARTAGLPAGLNTVLACSAEI